MKSQIHFPKMQGGIAARLVKQHCEPVEEHVSQSPVTLYLNSCYHEVSCVYKQKLKGVKGENGKQ